MSGDRAVPAAVWFGLRRARARQQRAAPGGRIAGNCARPSRTCARGWVSEPTDEQPPVVREQQTRNRPTGQGQTNSVEKLARRLDGLPGGRYALMITVGEDGVDRTDRTVLRQGRAAVTNATDRLSPLPR